MGKIYCFDPVIYPRVIWMTYDATPDQLNELFPDGDEFGESFEEFTEDSAAITSEVEAGDGSGLGGILIRFKNKSNITFGHSAHECSHAAICIFHYIHATVSYDFQETYCYLVEFIADCCEKLKKGNIDKSEIYIG